MKTQTLGEMHLLARSLFGEDVATWRFVCPQCGDVASVADWQKLGLEGKSGQECIGRHVKDRGCDWTAFGLISGPVEVSTPDGKIIHRFLFDGERRDNDEEVNMEESTPEETGGNGGETDPSEGGETPAPTEPTEGGETDASAPQGESGGETQPTE